MDQGETRLSVWFFFFPTLIFSFFLFSFLTLQYCIGFAIYQNESATGTHVFPILNPPPSSLPIPSLWVVPVHELQASSIMHRTWTTGDECFERFFLAVEFFIQMKYFIDEWTKWINQELFWHVGSLIFWSLVVTFRNSLDKFLYHPSLSF